MGLQRWPFVHSVFVFLCWTPVPEPVRFLDLTDWLSKLVYMNTKDVGAFEAKTHLSELLEQVRKGQVYRISKRGRPIAELRPVSQPHNQPRFGCDKGRVLVKDEFDDPLPEMEQYTA